MSGPRIEPWMTATDNASDNTAVRASVQWRHNKSGARLHMVRGEMWTYQAKEEEGGQVWGGKMGMRLRETWRGRGWGGGAGRAEWRMKLSSYTGDPRWQEKPGTKKKSKRAVSAYV